MEPSAPTPLVGLAPMVVSSYRFPPSGMPVHVRPVDVCRNTMVEFGNSLAQQMSRLSITLASELELIVNSILLGFSYSDCHIRRDNTFDLLVRHQTPASSPSLFSPSLSTANQDTGSLLGEQLESSHLNPLSASQPYTVRLISNSLIGLRFPSLSRGPCCPLLLLPISSLPSSELELYGGLKLDDSATLDFPSSVYHFWGIKFTDRGKQAIWKANGRKEIASNRIECTVSINDISMAIGNGKRMENDGLEDSKHAAALLQEVDTVAFVESGSTDYGSMPPFPSTLAETVSDSPKPLPPQERVSTMTPAVG